MDLWQFWDRYKFHYRATIKLSWPIIIGQMGQVLMGVVDTAMVGRIGEASVAAAGLSSSIFFLIAVFGIGGSTAVAPLVSIAASRKDKAESSGVLYGSYAAGIALSILLQVLMVLVCWKLSVLNQAPEVERLARSYLLIISFSTLPMILFLVVKQFADGLSFTRVSMVITLLAIPFNAFLNWLFIFGNCGFAKMNLDGAGYGTLITRTLMAIAMMLYLHKSEVIRSYIQEKPAHLKQYFKQVLQIGLPAGFQYFFEIAAFSLAMLMAGYIGVSEQAAHQIAINTAALTYMAVTGLAAAGSIRVGAGYGNQNKLEVQRAGWSSIHLGSGFMLFAGFTFLIFRQQIAEIFIENKEVQFITTQLLLIAALFQLSDGIQAICLGLLRGIKDVKRPTLITFISYWCIGIPMAYLLGFHTSLGVEGVWYGLLAGLTFSAVFLMWRFNRLSRSKPEIT